MRLVLFNGSPRHKKSNSGILIDQFLTGYRGVSSDPFSLHYIADRKEKQAALQSFQQAEIVLLIFPLYTDSMPGIVKEFFEDVAGLSISRPKKIGYIVQSGFPEAIHSVYVERYLEKFTGRIGCEYLGTVIRGGVEGIQIMPDSMTRKLFRRFQQLGEHFATHHSFSPVVTAVLRKPYRLSPARRMAIHLLSKTGLTNYYWNSHLKKYGAFENRFDQPFINP